MSAISASRPLSRIVLGLTGGIAAYKAAELARLLVKANIEVQVVMTAAACRFITPITMQALSGRAVYSDVWDTRPDNAMAHIELSRGADAILVAPASTDFLAKLAHGFADDLLSTLCVARECPLLVVPAMNVQMWQNAATQRNVAQLRADGIEILGPSSGDQACGEFGDGRMLEPQEILTSLIAWTQPKILAGKRVLITAGPTFEAIDPVRGITNSSSGKMGYAMAQAAAEAGAQVILISGLTALPTPADVARIDVVSAAEMLRAAHASADACDIFISVAAVADYTPLHGSSERKLKKNDGSLTLELQPTTDVLAAIAARPHAPYCVGFAAESHDVETNAEAKRKRKKLPLMIANRAQDALGSDANEVVLLDDTGRHPLPRTSKMELARRLVAEIAQRVRSV